MVATVLTPLSRINRYIRELQNEPLDSRKKYLCCPDFDLKPLIVPPTWMKEYNNRYLGNIWNVAIRKLADATIVLFWDIHSLNRTIRLDIFSIGHCICVVGCPGTKLSLLIRTSTRCCLLIKDSLARLSLLKEKFPNICIKLLESESRKIDFIN